MADHLDAPGLKSPNMNAEIDITDLFAFQKPGNPHKSILVLNVNPLAPTLADAFDPRAVYEILVDTDGDADAEIAYRVTFSSKEHGHQSATVRRVAREDLLHWGKEISDRSLGEDIVEHAPVSFSHNAHVTTRGEYRFFAGMRSDPFFFDLMGFLNGFKFTGDDFFADKNVFGIVLEVPNRALGPNRNVGVWARVLLPSSAAPGPATEQMHGGEHSSFTQVDRMGRPAINTVFNHGADKITFNHILPAKDRTTLTQDPNPQAGVTFLRSFELTLMALGGYGESDAEKIAKILLPDILTYDYASSSGFLNGRKLTDDVIDVELNLVSNGKVKTDMVGSHHDLLSSFPYLGNPH